MNYYAFGLRKTVPCKTVKQAETAIRRYEKYCAYLQLKYDIKMEYHFENKITKNGYHNVHLHGMMRTPREFKDNGWTPKERGLKVYCEKVQCKRAYLNYISKDKTSKQDIIDMIRLETEYKDSEEYIEIQSDLNAELNQEYEYLNKLKTRRIV